MNLVFHDAFPNLYRSGMNEPSPIAGARTIEVSGLNILPPQSHAVTLFFIVFFFQIDTIVIVLTS